MSELIALVIFGLLALVYHLTNDEPWTRIERRANCALMALAGIGKMVERALTSKPLVAEGARYPILGESELGRRTIGDFLEELGPGWSVERIRGYTQCYDAEQFRRAYREWHGFDSGPFPKYGAKIWCVLKNRRGEHEYCKSGLFGDDFEVLLRTFAGCSFSQEEVERAERNAITPLVF